MQDCEDAGPGIPYENDSHRVCSMEAFMRR